eukprot:scaffold78641_cov74-Phaeocystis_antarctica.AAC.5
MAATPRRRRVPRKSARTSHRYALATSWLPPARTVAPQRRHCSASGSLRGYSRRCRSDRFLLRSDEAQRRARRTTGQRDPHKARRAPPAARRPARTTLRGGRRASSAHPPG